jgi:hypothetical protein
MDIFDAIMEVRLGKRCSTFVGDTRYILSLRELENINYTPPLKYAGLGITQIKDSKVVSCTEFPAHVMCDTNWEISGIEDKIEIWLAFQLVPGNVQDSNTKEASALLKRALKKLRKIKEKKNRVK